MTKNIKKTENKIRQKMQEMLHKEDGFSFIEVIIVMAMILVLTAILIPNYLGFVETAREANVKMSAQNMYTAVQMANLTLDSLETSEELYLELKELNPAIVGVGAEYNINNNKCFYVYTDDPVEGENVDPIEATDLIDNCCAIGEITMEPGDLGYTFDYYQYMNNKLYCASFEEGTIVDVVSLEVAFPSGDFTMD